MRYSRLRKFRKRNPIYMLILKITVIWYVTLFTVAYFSTDTTAHYTYRSELAHSITAGVWEVGCGSGEQQKDGSGCSAAEEETNETDEGKEQVVVEDPAESAGEEETAGPALQEEKEKEMEPAAQESGNTDQQKQEEPVEQDVPSAEEQEIADPAPEEETEKKDMEVQGTKVEIGKDETIIEEERDEG